MPRPAGRPREGTGSGRARGALTGAAASGVGAVTVGRSKVTSANAGALRRRRHSSANTAANSAAAPAIHGQYQPGTVAGWVNAGVLVAGGVTAKSVGKVGTAGTANLGPVGSAPLAELGCPVGTDAVPAEVRAGWVDAGRDAVLGAGRAELAAGVAAGWLAAGLGAALGLGAGGSRGTAVVTTGLSRSTGPCDPGGAGLTVAPGRRQPPSDCASSMVGASPSPSTMALAAALKLPPDLLM